MTKKSWALFIVLVAMVAMLSSSTSFYFFKSKSLQGGGKDNGGSGQAIESETTSKATASSTASTSETLKPSFSSARPSSPTDTYTVEKNDTLFIIAQKFDQTWTEIMNANGMADADKIQAGKTIAIPQNQIVSFTVNQEKADKLQKSVDAGKDSFRLSPLETAKADSSPIYGLSAEDKWSDEKRNGSEATVTATKDANKYQIKLTQPCTKGDKGIWAIISIAPIK